uniref:Uncharacterized protein n=1 Tax=Cacopsylla melanoneura TaxID=428564 RepID=A0A8D8T5N7_9HEMI
MNGFHMDFSENYALKYASEVQSFHFGGSRVQVSLHTSSLSYKNCVYDDLKTKSFCTFSKDLNHGPPAILAHLEPIFAWIREQKPHLKMIHFLSDGPSTQYRNQLMFFMFGNMLDSYFPNLVYSTWNYYESGHGKGAPDGVGGTVKSTADRLVAEGNDLSSFEVLVSKLKERLRNVTIYVIEKDDISKMVSKVQKSKTIPFKGTLKVHQVSQNNATYQPIILTMKAMSCFCCRNMEDSGNDQQLRECPHYFLGKLKYDSRRTFTEISCQETEEISCEPDNMSHELCMDEPVITQETNLDFDKMKAGDSLLIKLAFKTEEYRYVCSILSVQKNQDQEENKFEITVQGMQNTNDEKNEFVVRENDIFNISTTDIIQILPTPNIVLKKRVITFVFTEPINVYEKK